MRVQDLPHLLELAQRVTHEEKIRTRAAAPGAAFSAVMGAVGLWFAARGWTGFVPAVALWGGCFLFMYLHTSSPIHLSVLLLCIPLPSSRTLPFR